MICRRFRLQLHPKVKNYGTITKTFYFNKIHVIFINSFGFEIIIKTDSFVIKTLYSFDFKKTDSKYMVFTYSMKRFLTVIHKLKPNN